MHGYIKLFQSLGLLEHNKFKQDTCFLQRFFRRMAGGVFSFEVIVVVMGIKPLELRKLSTACPSKRMPIKQQKRSCSECHLSYDKMQQITLTPYFSSSSANFTTKL